MLSQDTANGSRHPESQIHFIADVALRDAERILSKRLFKYKRDGHELIMLNPTRNDTNLGSFKFNLRTGEWADFAVGAKGSDLVSLVAYVEGGINQTAAARMIAEEIGIDHGLGVNRKQRRAHQKRQPSKDHPAANGRAGKTRTVDTMHDYVDEDGKLLFQVVRYQPKEFSQRRPDGDGGWVWNIKGVRVVPYRLPEITEAIGQDQPLFIPEGEKDVDNLTKLGVPATCNAGGAGKWRAEHAAYLKGADVIILPDNDDAGNGHAESVAASLNGIATRIHICHLPHLPPKGDVSDWLADGGTAEELWALVDKVPEWQPAKSSGQRQQGKGGSSSKIEPQLSVSCAADVTPERIEWLWPDRIALGKQTLIAGEAGLGKSQFGTSMAAVITTGGPWPCGEGIAPLGDVILLSAEDGPADTIVPRLMAAGADLTRVHLVTAVSEENGNRRTFNLQSDLALLEAEICKIGDVRMVLIDPISSYLGPKIDSHLNSAVRGVLEPVSDFAGRLRVAVVCITHPPKGTGTTAINRFIGSVAFVAAARAAFMVARDPDNEKRRLFLPVKNNLAPLGNGLAFHLEERIVGEPGNGIVASAVKWEGEHVKITADEALQAAETTDSASANATDDANDFLLKALADGAAMNVPDIEGEARKAGLLGDKESISQSKPFRNARRQLGIKPGKAGMDEGWIWALPKMPLRSEDAH